MWIESLYRIIASNFFNKAEQSCPIDKWSRTNCHQFLVENRNLLIIFMGVIGGGVSVCVLWNCIWLSDLRTHKDFMHNDKGVIANAQRRGGRLTFAEKFGVLLNSFNFFLKFFSRSSLWLVDRWKEQLAIKQKLRKCLWIFCWEFFLFFILIIINLMIAFQYVWFGMDIFLFGRLYMFEVHCVIWYYEYGCISDCISVGFIWMNI